MTAVQITFGSNHALQKAGFQIYFYFHVCFSSDGKQKETATHDTFSVCIFSDES